MHWKLHSDTVHTLKLHQTAYTYLYIANDSHSGGAGGLSALGRILSLIENVLGGFLAKFPQPVHTSLSIIFPE